MPSKHKFQWYQEIYEAIPEIRDAARKAGRELGVERFEQPIGLYAGSSSAPGPLPDYVLEPIVEANRSSLRSLQEVQDELRAIVKDIYGDAYDVAVTNTCEAGLRVAFETLFAPPTMTKGEPYRGRYLCPYGEDIEFVGAYGRPFPPRWKNLFADRSTSTGELGVEGKSLNNLDTVFVRFGGARYEAHGIRYNPVPLLVDIDPEETYGNLEATAERHAGDLVGVTSIGYDTPGYGYGEKDEDGVPVLKKRIGDLARRYDVPYVVDAASCVPVIGLSPADIGADVMMWSMDKACRAPISGLLVGREEAMIPIRKALGTGGGRRGGTSSHGKGSFAFADPGRDSIIGIIAVLKVLRDQPDRIREPIDRMHAIVLEEFEEFRPRRFRDDLVITRSYTMGGTELNYERTWKDGEFGIPLFTNEDLVGDTNPIMMATEAMGVYPSTTYSGSMFIGPGMGTLNRDGTLNEDAARVALRALVRSLEIVCRHAGLG